MDLDLSDLVELIEETLGRGWAFLAAGIAILIPIGILVLVATGTIDAELFG